MVRWSIIAYTPRPRLKSSARDSCAPSNTASDCRKITVNLYDRLFNVENPGEDDGRTLEEKLNPNSLTVLDSCLIEGGVESKPGSVFQFMRQGYFCEDKDSTSENPVFNRTVQLNSSWDKK